MPGVLPPRGGYKPAPAAPPRPFIPPTAPIYGRNQVGARVVVGNKPTTSFTHGGMGAPAPAPARTPAPAKKAPTKVVLHPDGRVEIVHHNAAAAPTVPASPTSKPIVLPKGGKGGAPGAFGSTTDIMTPQTLANARAARATASAAPNGPQTVAQQAQTLIDYATKAVSDPINARLTAQQQAINGSTQELADLMGKYGPASKAIYGDAKQGQAAVDSALGATLAGQGQSGQDALAAKLAAIDADPGTAARLNATAGANATGATGALAARGSSALSNLIGSGAAAEDLGAKLPGIAGEFGLQATRTAQRQGTTDLANAVSAVESKFPDVVNQIQTTRQQQSANETTRALAATQALGHAPAWAAKILGVAPGTPSSAVAIAKTRAGATKTAATTKATATANKVNLPLSKEFKVLVNANGDPVLKNGKLVSLPGSTTDGLSVKDFKKYRSQAKAGAILAHNGGQDAKGNTLPPISWLQYRQHGLAAGIPEEILIAEGKHVYSPREIKLGLIPGQGPKRDR